ISEECGLLTSFGCGRLVSVAHRHTNLNLVGDLDAGPVGHPLGHYLSDRPVVRHLHAAGANFRLANPYLFPVLLYHGSVLGHRNFVGLNFLALHGNLDVVGLDLLAQLGHRDALGAGFLTRARDSDGVGPRFRAPSAHGDAIGFGPLFSDLLGNFDRVLLTNRSVFGHRNLLGPNFLPGRRDANGVRPRLGPHAADRHGVLLGSLLGDLLRNSDCVLLSDRPAFSNGEALGARLLTDRGNAHGIGPRLGLRSADGHGIGLGPLLGDLRRDSDRVLLSDRPAFGHRDLLGPRLLSDRGNAHGIRPRFRPLGADGHAIGLGPLFGHLLGHADGVLLSDWPAFGHRHLLMPRFLPYRWCPEGIRPSS